MSKIYFDPKFFKFLQNLKQNNNRIWFNKNKTLYEEDIKFPLFNFLSDLSFALSDITDDYLAIPKINGGSVFRIYRDIRFSKDKTPYKTHIAAQLLHKYGINVHCPGFYFHLEPNNIKIGGGIWMPNTNKARNIRLYIQDNKEKFLTIINNKNFQKYFKNIDGESLVRLPKYINNQNNNVIAKYLKLKSWFVMQTIDEEIFYSKEFLPLTLTMIKAGVPLLNFLYNASTYEI